MFNKIDLCTNSDVVDDYRRVLEGSHLPVSEVYALSAKRAVGELTTERGTTTDQFRSLEEFIASELDRTRIREIEAENLGERMTEVFTFIESTLPPRWESAAEAWRDHCQEVLSRFFAEIATMIGRRALDREELADAITVSRGSALSGPFGFVAEVIYALHRFRSGGSSLMRFDATETWIKANVGVSLSDTIDRRTAFVQETCCYDGILFGLDPQALRDAMENSMGDHVKERGWCEERLASHLHAELKHHSRPPGIWMNVLVNILPWAWILYWIYRLVVPVLSAEPVPWEAIPGAAVAFVALMFLQWSVVHKLLKWNAKKRAGAVISRVLSGVETAFLARRLPAIEHAADRVQACTHEIKQSLLALQSLALNKEDDSVPGRFATSSAPTPRKSYMSSDGSEQEEYPA